METTDEILDSLPPFSELPPTARKRLHANLTRRRAAPGADILSPGDVVNGVYFVLSGDIRVYYVGPEGR